jgi:hypothetical protein
MGSIFALAHLSAAGFGEIVLAADGTPLVAP